LSEMESSLQGSGAEPDLQYLGKIGDDLQAEESVLKEKLQRIESLKLKAEILKSKHKASQEKLARLAEDEKIQAYRASFINKPEIRLKGIRKGINVIYQEAMVGEPS
jgi:hypothetical protein